MSTNDPHTTPAAGGGFERMGAQDTDTTHGRPVLAWCDCGHAWALRGIHSLPHLEEVLGLVMVTP